MRRLKISERQTHLLETDLSSPLPEALTADEESVSSDETGLVGTDSTANDSSIAVSIMNPFENGEKTHHCLEPFP